MSNSTFSANKAKVGGGIYVTSYRGFGGVIVTNSTFSGNSANSGGGILSSEGNVWVSNSTLSGNTAEYGGGIWATFEAVRLINTIVADSSSGDNCTGGITDGGGNLSYPDTTCPGINADPKLGLLQNNGGASQTMALLPGSAAIDAGNDAICAAAPVNSLDQRGITRPQGLHCDIGAFEAILHRAYLPLIMR